MQEAKAIDAGAGAQAAGGGEREAVVFGPGGRAVEVRERARECVSERERVSERE